MSVFRRHPHLAEDVDDDDIIVEDVSMIDPELRLRTVRTAASTIAEANRTDSLREQWRKRRQRNLSRKGTFSSRIFRRGTKAKKDQDVPPLTTDDPRDKPMGVSQVEGPEKVVPPPGKRRDVHVNVPLPRTMLDARGEPITRYPRNKVRTSKYTIITFVPKNLSEQFTRAANIFFLSTVILSVFPIFGATTPQISMLPLVFIVVVTAVKDGIEDYRRASLDEEVNNSAATKLGDWRNVNQPVDPRSAFERLLGIGRTPGKVTRGVRKLREKEASNSTNMIQLTRDGGEDTPAGLAQLPGHGKSMSEASFDVQHLYPPPSEGASASGGSSSYTYPPPVPGQPEAEAKRSLSSILPDTSQYALSTRSMRSDGVVDYNRQTSGTTHWERTLWKKLEVGDIVLLRDNDQIPADIVVLSTSDANGVCYVETKNLDGETNLKPRKALKATSSILSEEDLEHAAFILDAEPPHPNLYSFNGVLKYRSPPSGIVNPTSASSAEKLEPITINELLLRGCAVRNTKWIIGIVVFTGSDTKIMLNGGETPSKRSKIERETNFNVVMNFFVLAALCLIAAIANGFYYARGNTSGDFFYETQAAPSKIPGIDAVVTFGSALVAFQNIVPISLYISIEIVKTIQAFFIAQDVDMFYEPLNAACVPKTWNISDDLGQIEYIFSDKTGTLTQNIMEFQKCSINGISYGEGITEAMRGAAKRQGRSDLMSPQEQDIYLGQLKADMLQTMNRAFKNRYAQPDKLTLISTVLADALASPPDADVPSERGAVVAFFRALAICHGVIAERAEPMEKPFEIEYKAESPDEAALVAAARDVGFTFVSRTNNALDVEVLGQPERYVPLKVLEFNSTRKRMSVIVRTPEGKIVLYSKGADSVILARLRADHDPELKRKTEQDLEAYANGGLRTLCVAYRVLEEQEYLGWERTFDAAAAATQDREEEIEKASDFIEQGLTLLGATALEDKLQEGVPETIELLHRAGIKLWVLTGDKLQTAIEIGFSCNLLKSEMEVMILSADSLEGARLQIEGGLNKIASMTAPPGNADPDRKPHTAGFAVVIDGETLRYALDGSLKNLFLMLGTQCDTVVCCRVSPAQKALTVKLVKDGRGAMTLSIGDGANDVAMIQEANVGCGLLGLEGSQAAMSADYAFGQFRYLGKLLIVHGRWSYQRISDMHANFFYKNVIWTLAMFWFGIFSNFDATYLYDVTFILTYNVVFTSLPVIALGAFDQDLNAKASMAFPQLYYRGVLGLEYTRTKFWIYMADGLYQSVIVFFIPWLAWTIGTPVSYNGKGIDSLADFGTTVAVAAVICANVFVGFNNRYWTVITWVVIVGSTLACFIWIAIYSAFETPNYRDESGILFSSPYFWFSVFLAVAWALGPRVLSKAISQIYYPLDRDIVREAWVAGDLKEQLGVRHRYRKNKHPYENATLVSNRTRSVDHLPAIGLADDDYVPIHITAPDLESRTPQSDRSMSPPRSGGIDQRLMGSVSGANTPISPAISYYSASALPLSSSSDSRPLPNSSSIPSTPTRRPSLPNAYVHESRSPFQSSIDGGGGEYEMRIRPSPSSPPSASVLSAPDDRRAGIRERQESHFASLGSSTGSASQRASQLVPIDNNFDRDGDDGSSTWSGPMAV